MYIYVHVIIYIYIYIYIYLTRSIDSQSLPFTLNLCFQESFQKACRSFQGSRNNENATKSRKNRLANRKYISV